MYEEGAGLVEASDDGSNYFIYCLQRPETQPLVFVIIINVAIIEFREFRVMEKGDSSSWGAWSRNSLALSATISVELLPTGLVEGASFLVVLTL